MTTPLLAPLAFLLALLGPAPAEPSVLLGLAAVLVLAQLRSGHAAAAIAGQLAELRRRHRDDPALPPSRTGVVDWWARVFNGREVAVRMAV